MKTILYINKTNEIRRNLINVIQSRLSGISIQTCHAIADLSHLLRQPLQKVSVLILFIESIDEVEALNLMTSLFDNIRIILILPDMEKSTVSLCVALKPSFITYAGADLLDIALVLEKIQQKNRN